MEKPGHQQSQSLRPARGLPVVAKEVVNAVGLMTSLQIKGLEFRVLGFSLRSKALKFGAGIRASAGFRVWRFRL